MAKILVIDDEPSIINLVTAYLKPEGYEVYTASDGNAGLKAARTFKPDLIILDLMLPRKSGFDGDIYCTFATRDLCSTMLMDSGSIHERDADYPAWVASLVRKSEILTDTFSRCTDPREAANSCNASSGMRVTTGVVAPPMRPKTWLMQLGHSSL